MGRESLADEVTDQESGVKQRRTSRYRVRSRGTEGEGESWKKNGMSNRMGEAVGECVRVVGEGTWGMHVAAQFTVLHMECMVVL